MTLQLFITKGGSSCMTPSTHLCTALRGILFFIFITVTSSLKSKPHLFQANEKPLLRLTI